MVQSKYTIKRTELAKKTKNNKIDKKVTKKVDKTLDSTSTNLTENVPDIMTVPDIIVPDIIEPTTVPDILAPNIIASEPDIIAPDLIDIKPPKICQLKEKNKIETKKIETKKMKKKIETTKIETTKIEKKKIETKEMGEETKEMGEETKEMGEETRELGEETRELGEETKEMWKNENIKKILITNENQLIDETPPVKLKINKIGFKVAKVSVNSNLVVDNINSENVVDRGEEDVVDKEVGEEPEGEEKKEAPRKRKEVSKECMQLAIKILKKIDPKNQMKKEDVIIILKEYSQSVNDLAIIQAVEYLLDSFDNLEENFKNFEENRIKQEKGLFKTDRLDKETFENRISLDSEDREPDENDRIFRQGKEIFSGSFQKYKKIGSLEEKKFKSIIAPKKDLKKLKQYGLA
jgi:hypothetical protein